MNEESTPYDESYMPPSGRMSLKLIRISRLKQFFTHRGVEELAEKAKTIGKQVNQTSDLLNGRVSFGEKVARSIEESAGLPPGWLDSVGDGQNTAVGPVIHGRVPLISNVQAGMYKDLVDNLLQPGDTAYELIPTTVPIKRHTFALRVVGDSMEPRYVEGDVLVVEPEMDPTPGDLVIAKNGDGETTFKQLVKDGADWYLKPLNDRYPIKPLGNSTIVGVVRAVELRIR